MKRIEDSLRDISDNIKCINIRAIGVPGQEDKKKSSQNSFEEIIVENSPSLGKKIVNQVQEVWKAPYKINPRKNTIKLTEIKHKEGTLKAARGNQ